MNRRIYIPALLATLLWISACGGGGGGASQNAENPAGNVPSPSSAGSATETPELSASPEAVVTFTPSAAATDGAEPTSTPPAGESSPVATPSPTQAAPALGPRITYFGVARADDRPIEASSFDGAGRPVYVRGLGRAMSLIVEAELGLDRSPIEIDAFDPSGLAPGLQMIVSRQLGDGNAALCDNFEPLIGGVPATSPFRFSEEPRVLGAMNDLACKVNDGAGNPVARRSSDQACTRIGVGREFSFVDRRSRVQFCLPIAGAWQFPRGDSLVAARVRSIAGTVGAPAEIVVHIGLPAGTGTATVTRTATSTPATPGPSSTPAPTFTPLPPELGAEITYFGVSTADDTPLLPVGFDAGGRPIYARRLGQGMSLIVEARRGQRPLRRDAFDPTGGAPGLQMILSRPLGDGSVEVCDKFDPVIGGIPATVPFEFSQEPAVIDAMNDLGCRVNDGTGQSLARSGPADACTRIGVTREFDFVDTRTSIQFCLPIAQAWAFDDGDTIVAARLADALGSVGLAREIVVRVGAP